MDIKLGIYKYRFNPHKLFEVKYIGEKYVFGASLHSNAECMIHFNSFKTHWEWQPSLPQTGDRYQRCGDKQIVQVIEVYESKENPGTFLVKYVLFSSHRTSCWKFQDLEAFLKNKTKIE